MKVTSTQIAQKLGISRSTVSRALSGYPYVNENLRMRVLDTAREMGYRPNQAAQSLAKGEQLLIGVVVYSSPKEYWGRVLRGVELAAKQLHDYGVMVEPVITDILKPREQVTAMHDLVRRGARAIVLSPSVPSEVAEAIDQLMGQGIQILLLNTDVPQSSRLCYVGSDYVQAGKLAGELLGRFLCGRGRIAAIVYDDLGSMIPQKLTGFREEISRFPKLEMLGPYKFSRTGESVYDNTRALIRGEKPDGIFMTYGEIESVAQAVKDEGMAGRLALVGYDMFTRALADLRERTIYALIGQEPEQQGMLCVRILHDFLARGIRPKSSVIHARLEVVTAQNGAYYREEALNAYTYYYL